VAKQLTHPEYCIHEREWGETMALLDKISKDVYGNGDAGLVKTIPRLEEKINHLVNTTAAHTQVISKVLEFQASHDGTENERKNKIIRDQIAVELISTKQRDKWQRVMWVIIAFVGIAGLGISIYFGALGNRKQDVVNDKVDQMGQPIVTRSGKILWWPRDSGVIEDLIKKDSTK